MSVDATALKVAELREEFDRTFAAPPPELAAGLEDLLAIRISDDAYAIRLRELGGLIARPTIVAVPGGNQHLLGLAGVRGRIVPVFDLRGLLGYAAGADAPRWLALDSNEDPIALAFDGFDGYLRVSRPDIHALESRQGTRPFLAEAVRTSSETRTLIDARQLIASLRGASRAGASGS